MVFFFKPDIVKVDSVKVKLAYIYRLKKKKTFSKRD
jgi:hypothetical protein